MDNTIRYLNTDLDLRSVDDLSGLAEALTTADVFALDVSQFADGLWHALFEANDEVREPESNIATMLAAIESLPPELRAVWDRCTLREFNIGYDCGAEPRSFCQALSADLLGRMAAAGGSLGITLYPNSDSRS